LAITSLLGKLLLIVAALAIAGGGLTMIKVQISSDGTATYRTLQLAGASTIVGLLALGAAFLIS
jgi:hypothetical protein